MNDLNMLETFKKHLGELGNTRATSTSIYNFGENMKGMNEFIGAAQMLNINLTKIRNLGEKINCIEDLLQDSKSESNDKTALNMQKSANLANIKYILEGAQFMGVNLFDTQLSCAISGAVFEIFVQNPLNRKDDDIVGYCTQKILEITNVLSAISEALNSSDNTAIRADSEMIRAYKNI